MKYLIIGAGGREHALSWRLMSDGSAEKVYVAPGNGGIEEGSRVDIGVDDFEAIARFCIDKEIDMVVVGPEVPLVKGIVDFLEDRGIAVFGPRREAAMIEGSKLFAKRIMETCNVPTAGYWDFTGRGPITDFVKSRDKYPLVIKLDGLAAGKGVAIPESVDEALEFINSNVRDDSRVFVEEFLEGEEASVLGICDGVNVVPLVAAQDHKRIFDEDKGPNTGGMGAYAPAPVVTPEKMEFIKKNVLQPVVDGMRKEGIPFKGVLYAGLMINGDEIKVLEFNARFGDPETQVILPLLEGKLGDILKASIDGTLDRAPVKFKSGNAITVVMSAAGYPGDYVKGDEITGLESISEKVQVFHAGTVSKDGLVYTNGGRVLNVTAAGDSLEDARNLVYSEIDKIKFNGAFYRKDIAYRAL
jgi:phosphoribosylamine--glycine ligase